MATKSEIIKWLIFLKDKFPGSPELSSDATAFWADRLTQYSIEVLVYAAGILVDRLEWFPKLAQIHKVCEEITGGDESSVPLAGEAWDEVQRQAFLQGARCTPEFSHEAIMQAVRGVGGWRYLCLSENSVADRARFYEVYATFAERAQREESIPEGARQLRAQYRGLLSEGD